MQPQTATAATYVSPRSANALISDLRPTTISPPALQHLNLVLDELLEALVEAAGSIDPKDIKVKGVPKVFADVVVTGSAPGTPHRSPAKESFRDRTISTTNAASPISNKTTSAGAGKTRVRTSSSMYFRAISSSLQVTKYAASLALGREAVNEAELELKAWKDGGGGGGRHSANSEQRGFMRDPRGLRRTSSEVQEGNAQSGNAVSFPVAEAVEVLRCRVNQYSTLGNSESPDPSAWESVIDAWIKAGGSEEEDVLNPAGLYLTAIIEHISERILSGIGKVVARATSSTTAGMYDLYTALCEDEGLWGFFRRLSVKTTIEELLQITPASTTYNLGRTTTRSSYGGSSLHLPAGRTSFDHGASGAGGMVSTPSGGIRGPSIDFSTPPRPSSTVQQQQQRKLSSSGGSRTGRMSFDSPRPSIAGLLGRRRSSAVLQQTASLFGGQQNPALGSGGGRMSISLDNGGADARLALAGGGGEDEFDALVATAQTVRVTLTPSRLKTFPSASREVDSSPVGGVKRAAEERASSSSSSLAPVSVPFPAGMDTPKRSLHANDGRDVPDLKGRGFISTTRTEPGTGADGTGADGTGVEKGISSLPSTGQGAVKFEGQGMLARDESRMGKESPMTTETLKEVLQSDPPPWASPSPAPKLAAKEDMPVHSALPVLGTPMRMEPRIEVTPQSARIRENSTPFAESRTSEFTELADFLMNTPPPPQALSLSEGSGSHRGSGSLLATEANKRDSSLAENTGRLKSLVSRVTWNKSPEKNGGIGNSGSMADIASLERNGSASSQTKLGRKSDTTAGNGKSYPGTGRAPSPSYGLFSSRDRHIVDEYIGPSTVGADGTQQRDRDGGLFRSMVEVGSLPGTAGSTEESSILAPDTESYGSINPEFYAPHTAPHNGNGTSIPLGHSPPIIMTGQSQNPEVKKIPNGNDKGPSQLIPLVDVLQLQQGMAQAKSASECQTLVDELLRRYGVA